MPNNMSPKLNPFEAVGLLASLTAIGEWRAHKCALDYANVTDLAANYIT